MKTTTVTVSDTGSPIVLLIDTARPKGDLVWRFNVEPGANLVGVHFVSDKLPMLEGLPANIPVTARYTVDQEDDAKNDCVYQPVTEPSLAEYGPQNFISPKQLFRSFRAIRSLQDLDRNLFKYAGINVVSFQYSAGGWEDGAAEVSAASVQEFVETKVRGQRLVDEAVPPDFPYLSPSAEVLRIPENLESDELWPWIISKGYAMVAPTELVEYNCEITRLLVMTLGLDVPRIRNCRWRGFPGDRDRQIGIVLLGSIVMTEETCRKFPSRNWIMSIPEISITPSPPDCSQQPRDINQKAFWGTF